MDKRSIIFIVCITLAFFGVHTWFDSQRNTQQVKQESGAVSPQASESAAEMETPRAPFQQQISGDEEFYVLENDYQQLVFSTRGGSLAEINLPFSGKEDPKSIVKEIDVDRSILKQSPETPAFLFSLTG